MTCKIAVVLVLVAGFGLINGEIFVQEKPCARVGGQCLLKRDCSNNISDRYLNLCSKQKHLGAECCRPSSFSEVRCPRIIAHCISTPFCMKTIIKKATNCGAGKVCCMI